MQFAIFPVQPTYTPYDANMQGNRYVKFNEYNLDYILPPSESLNVQLIQ